MKRAQSRDVLLVPLVFSKAEIRKRVRVPVYAYRRGLALHQAWRHDGPEPWTSFVLSAMPSGAFVCRVGEFSKAARLWKILSDAMDWRGVTPKNAKARAGRLVPIMKRYGATK